MAANEVKSLSIDQKIGQMLVIGLPGTIIDDEVRFFVEKIRPGGICLFTRNIKNAEQVRALNDDITSFLSLKPMISIDQEGGLVDRLRRIITPMPAPALFNNAEEVREYAGLNGEILRILGFNTNFAPVVDVINEDRGKVQNGLQTRNFGSNADELIELAGTFLDEIQSKGIIGCLKHFPGLGASTIDSHNSLPEVQIDASEFYDIDLKPYRSLLATGNVLSIMVAHAAFPLLDRQEIDQDGRYLPSSLSHNMVTSLLRDECGYDGVVITDDLEMGAIVTNYGIGEACVMAVKAGVDMLAICASRDAINEGYETLLKAVIDGDITEERIDRSLERIAKLRERFSEPLKFDLEKIREISDRIADLISRLS